MTRQEKDRQRYLEHQEERQKHQREYYDAHCEEILAKKRRGMIR